MKQYSNTYIIGFAAGVCLICSIVVATSAVVLKERQDLNKVLDRQKKVLIVADLLEEGLNNLVPVKQTLHKFHCPLSIPNSQDKPPVHLSSNLRCQSLSGWQ